MYGARGEDVPAVHKTLALILSSGQIVSCTLGSVQLN